MRHCLTLVTASLALAGIVGTGPGQPPSRPTDPANDKKQALTEYARGHNGDAAAGKKWLLANRLGCLSCHGPLGGGGDLGPDLSLVGCKHDRATLLKKILEPRPSSAMPRDFAEHLKQQELVDLLAYLSVCRKKS